MDNNNELEREEFDKKVKRNIRRIILIIVIVFAIGIVINQIYSSYKEKLDIERDRVSHTNEDIIREYISYLRDINELSINMICGIDIDNEYKDVSLRLNRYKFEKLSRLSYNYEKYNISRLEHSVYNNRSYFHENSNWCIRGLLLEEQISKEQKEYLSEVYKVNNKIIETYQNNYNKMYVDGKRDKEKYNELYYEGRMYYDLINRLYEATDGRDFDITTKLDIRREYPEKEIRKEDILNKTEKEYAKILANILTGQDKEFNVYNDGMASKYTFKNNSSKYITVGKKDNYLYYNNETITQGDLSEELVDDKANEIINKFGVKYLKLVNKEYEDYFTSKLDTKFYGYEYQYYIIDDKYIDLSAYVKIIILTNGEIHEVQVTHLNIVDGTYKKLEPKITMQEAKSILEDNVQQNIKSYRLIRISNDLIYEFNFNLYDMKLYVGVNADTGEISYYRDHSYRDIVE